MSGHYLKNPTDASKFRQQYLSNLALQINIDDENLQANKIYKRTGQTPTQPTDFRTTSEKLGDIENLKRDLRGELAQIADGPNSDKIVNSLDPIQLQFLAQHINEIVRDIKPKYKYGVDALVFIPYLETYMRKANFTNEVNLGLQQSPSVILSTQQYESNMINPNIIKIVYDKVSSNKELFPAGLYENLLYNLTKLNDYLPSQQLLLNISNETDANKKENLQRELNSAYQDFPTQTQLLNMIKLLDVGLRNKDKPYLENIGFQLLSLITLSDATEQQINLIGQEILGRTPTPQTKAEIQLTRTQINYIATHYRDDNDEIFNRIATADRTQKQANELSKTNIIDYIKEMKNNTKLFTLKDIGFSSKATLNKLRGTLAKVNDIIRPYFEELSAPKKMGGVGLKKTIKVIKGNGVSYYKPKPLEIDYNEGIKKKYTYVPFGNNFIDKHNLSNNIIHIKRSNGASVLGFPKARVSDNLGNVMRSIVGNGIAKYDDLEKLTEEEKLYLYKLIKSNKLLNRLSIPAPSKKEDDKDIHQYEVMKGEILNGNDNVEMIKKFKLLISKLIHKDLLPKNQAKEILIELASLGY